MQAQVVRVLRLLQRTEVKNVASDLRLELCGKISLPC